MSRTISKTIRDEIVERVMEATNIILDNPDETVRSIAKNLGVSKSTIHKDLADRLPNIDPNAFEQVKAILEEHWNYKHIKGGEATRQLYLNQAKS